MNLLARLSLLIVALLVSGFSFGFAPVQADEFPKDTNTIEGLTPEQARKLAEEFPGVGVEIEIKGYGKHRVTGCLPLNGLKSLDAETAKSLAVYKGPLLLNGLTTLDTDTAKALAEFKGHALYLNGLTTLSVDVAKTLAQHKRLLYLNGLTTLDADIAKALAGFKGRWLFLNGLTTLDADTAKALAELKGILSLDGLTTLDAEAAKALAANDKWTADLSAVTALDSPDSVAIAQALAKRKGALKLRNLKKISPKTLSALIAKEDVEIPLIETLELIPEPDGSATEDFVIPEWLEERQQQKSGVQAAE